MAASRKVTDAKVMKLTRNSRHSVLGSNENSFRRRYVSLDRVLPKLEKRTGSLSYEQYQSMALSGHTPCESDLDGLKRR